MDAPCHDHRIDAPCRRDEVSVVHRAYGVPGATKLTRVGRAEREQVHDLDAAVAPGARETDAAPDRRIVVGRVRCGRIEHAEPDDGTVRPAAPQAVAMDATGAERRAAAHA